MLYRDSLGRLNSKASISVFGDKYGVGGYLSFLTITDDPHKGMRWDNTPEAIATIADWAEENGYDITEGKDGHGAYCAHLIHRETQAAIEIEDSKSDAKFANAEPGYVRFGDLPESGYSLNGADGTYELGVSVFHAEFVGEAFRILPKTPQAECTMFSVIAGNRPVYRVWGEEVGIGSDGEPVLRVDKKVLLT